MNIYTTKLASQQEKLPTKYDFEKILLSRQPIYADNRELENSFYRTKKGMEGEKKLLEFLQEFGRDHWVVFQNVWLNYYGHFEIDLVFQTRAKHYLFEVKNYEGGFSYKDGLCYLDGKKLSQNPVTQAQRAHLNFRNMCQYANFQTPVETILLLIGPFNWLDEVEPVKDLTILTANQMKSYINQIRLEENKYQSQNLQPERLIKILEQHEIANPFLPTPLTKEELANLQKGISCHHCGNFETKLKNRYIYCSCQNRELRKEAVIRTIYEYGVLNYDQPLHSGKLTDFFGGAVSQDYIAKILRENFDKKNQEGNPIYKNKKQPLNKIF